MVSLPNVAIGALVFLLIAVSFMNPDGLIVGLFLATIVIGVVLLVPFVQEYVLSVNKGKAARKTPDKSNGGSQRK